VASFAHVYVVFVVHDSTHACKVGFWIELEALDMTRVSVIECKSPGKVISKESIVGIDIKPHA